MTPLYDLNLAKDEIPAVLIIEGEVVQPMPKR